MYELKKNGKVFTSKFVGTGRGLRLIKNNLPGRGLTKVEKHCSLVGSAAGLDDFPLPTIEPRFFGRPSRSLATIPTKLSEVLK
jgi:hypothetical protein